MYAFFTARVCRETDCAVFVADYRLAPEFPYPAGDEDATAVYDALRDLGVPNERLFLAGDSGGGGLANSMLLACAGGRRQAIHPAGLILFSPEVDLRLDEPSVTENAKLDILPWNIPTASYLHGEDASSASISPLIANLDGFPPTFVAWGGDEMFRDPIRRYAARLQAAGRAHPRPRVRGHVPRLPDPHALGREEPPDLRPPPDLRAEAGGRRPDVRPGRPARPARSVDALRQLTSPFPPRPIPEAHNWNHSFRFC